MVPPTRVTTAIKTPAGEKAALAPEVPVPGNAMRQEVEEKYRAFEVELGLPSLFWGRYLESKWYVAAAPGPAGRIWHTRNILASFDENSHMRSFEIIEDKELLKRLSSLQGELKLPPPDFSKPVGLVCSWWALPDRQMGVELTDAGVTLDFSSKEWAQSKRRWPETVFVPAEQVSGLDALDVGSVVGGEFSTPKSKLAFKFSKKTAVGKYFEFYAEPRDVLALASWYEQVKRPHVAVRMARVPEGM